MSHPALPRRLAGPAAAWLAGCLLAHPAHAAVIVVNIKSDGAVTPGGICELRNAVRAANDDAPSGGCSAGSGADVIDLTQLTGLPDSIDLDAGEGPIVVESELSIVGPGADRLTVSGQGAIQVFRIDPGGIAEISGLTLADGATSQLGRGGGLQVMPGAEAHLIDCRVTGSSAFNGGGIVNDGALRVERCTIDGNQTTGNSGGGIGNAGQLRVENSTLSGNTATGDGVGGGLGNFLGEGGPVSAELYNVTLSGNAASLGGALYNDADLVLSHVLLADSPGGGNCSGPVVSLGHNLSDDPTCGLSGPDDLEAVAAALGPLADNGGPTPTHALDLASPALDAGDPACADGDAVPFDVDQRGEPRPTDGDGLGAFECDIGAYEALPEPGAGASALAALAGLAAATRRRPGSARSPLRRSRGC